MEALAQVPKLRTKYDRGCDVDDPKQSFVNGQHASFLGKYVSVPSGVLRKLQELRLPNTVAASLGVCDPWDLGVVGWLL